MPPSTIQVLARLTVVVLIGIGLVASMGFAVSPEWHHAAHSDSHEEDHECLATALLSGSCDTAVVAVLSLDRILPAIERVVGPSNARVRQSFHLSCRILEHAPPVATLS